MVVIVGHLNPDFDCVGAMIGARRLYPEALLVLPGPAGGAVADYLQLHAGFAPTLEPEQVDPETLTLIVVVDLCRRKRLGACATWLDQEGVEVHRWDHHSGESDITASGGAVEAVGATATLVALELRARDDAPTELEASAMLLGIHTDTGSFITPETTATDLEAAAWLMNCGARLDAVDEFLRRGLSRSQQELVQHFLESLELIETAAGPVALVQSDRGGGEQASPAVHALLDLAPAETVAALLAAGETVFVIGRSRDPNVDLAAAFEGLGGGGHRGAASATLHQTALAEARRRVIAGITRHASPGVTAGAIMSRPARSVEPDATVAEAHDRMIRFGHSGLIVLDGPRLAGIVTRRDVDRARRHRMERKPVSAIMTVDVETVTPDANLEEIEQRMLRVGVGRLPVVSEGEVLGMVTRTDLLRALHGERYTRTGAVPESDPAAAFRTELPARIQRLLIEAGQAARELECELYAVGGFVRDLLLHEPNLDIDLLAEPEAAPLARRLSELWSAELHLEDAFGTATVTLPDGLRIDFATARSESYEHPGALPQVVASSVADDLRRRDFTVNAMAFSLRPDRFGELLDPYHGLSDLRHRRLRVLHPLSFIEDPTRLFRAARFESRQNFRLTPHNLEMARAAVAGDSLTRISAHRLRMELLRTLREDDPIGALLRLEALGVWSRLAPGLTLDVELLAAAAAGSEWASSHELALEKEMVLLAALAAPLEPEEAEELLRDRLGIQGEGLARLTEAITASAEQLLDPEQRPSVRHSLLEERRPLTLALLFARCVAGRLRDHRALLEQFVERGRHVKLSISGHDLMELGYGAGPELGRALAAAKAALLDGDAPGAPEQLAAAVEALGPAPVRAES